MTARRQFIKMTAFNFSVCKTWLLHMIKVYGYTSIFSRHIFKERQFSWLPVCLPGDEDFLNGLYPYREEFAATGAKSFLYDMTSIYMGGNNEKRKLLPLI